MTPAMPFHYTENETQTLLQRTQWGPPLSPGESPHCRHADSFEVSDHQALHHLSFYQRWTQNMQLHFFMSLAPLSSNFGLNLISLNRADSLDAFVPLPMFHLFTLTGL